MYKQAIDILMADDTDLVVIAIQIAKSNPSIFVKASMDIHEPVVLTAVQEFESIYGSAFRRNPTITQLQYNNIINSIGYLDNCGEIMTYLFDRGNNGHAQKIEAMMPITEATRLTE